MLNDRKFWWGALVSLAVSAQASAPAGAASPTFDKIKQTGTVTIGYREASIPFSYLGSNQEPVGFSMDLCAPIVDGLKSKLGLDKLTVKYVPVNSSNRIPLLQNGTYDIECGGTANNAERQKQVAFSVATFVSQPKWLTKTMSGVADVRGLKGKTVVVTQGSNAVGFAFTIDKQANDAFKIVQGKDHAESMLMLETGRAAAFMEDDILLAGLKVRSPNAAELTFLPDAYERTCYGLMVRKDDPEFKQVVDGTLETMMASNEFSRLYVKWFQSPIPPRGDNLDFPMSDALKERIAHPSDRPE